VQRALYRGKTSHMRIGAGRPRHSAIAAAAVLALGFVSAAGAQAPEAASETDISQGWSEAAERCYAASDPQAGVVLCTEAIDQGGLSQANLAITFSNRGNSYFDLGLFERAIADYDVALELNPNDTVTLSNRGAALTDLGRLEAAIADFDKAVALDPVNFVALSNRCWAKALQSQYGAALEDCDAALALDPFDPVALSSRAYVNLRQGNLDEALSDADLAVRYGNASWKTWYYRGLVREARGETEAALADFRAAAKRGVSDPKVREAMAELGLLE